MTQKKKLLLVGAGGHGRVAADVAVQCKTYSEIAFLDDNALSGKSFPVLGKVAEAIHFMDSADFFVAVGDSSVRKRIQETLKSFGANIASLIHPNAVIGSDVQIGEGTIIMAGTVVNTGTVLEKGVIVNTCSSVDHDCTVGEFSHISVGAHLAGTVTVGNDVFVGAGATVINNIRICPGCVIAAGAVVIKDIQEKGVYMGVPAKVSEKYKPVRGGKNHFLKYATFCAAVG